MITKIIRYSIERKNIFAVRQAIFTFLDAVKKHEPNTKYFIYETVAETKFFHVVEFENSNAEDTHRKATYTKEFIRVIYPLATEGPVFENVRDIDALRN